MNLKGKSFLKLLDLTKMEEGHKAVLLKLMAEQGLI